MLDIPIELVYLIHEMNESMHKQGMCLLDQALDINYNLHRGYALDYSHAKCIGVAKTSYRLFIIVVVDKESVQFSSCEIEPVKTSYQSTSLNYIIRLFFF